MITERLYMTGNPVPEAKWVLRGRIVTNNTSPLYGNNENIQYVITEKGKKSLFSSVPSLDDKHWPSLQEALSDGSTWLWWTSLRRTPMTTPVLGSTLEEYLSKTSPWLLTSQRKMVKLIVIFNQSTWSWTISPAICNCCKKDYDKKKSFRD